MTDPRLGRIYVPDDRDWSPQRLHALLDLAGIPDPDLTEPLGQAIADSPYFASWPAYRSLWRYAKAHRHPAPAPGPAPGPILWADPIVLDQGNFGTCVGNGWAGWGDSDPVEDHLLEADARAIYFEATKFDGQPDDPDAPGGGQQGSTVRSGAKAMQARGRLTAYAFAGSIDDVDHWLDEHGPVVFGSDWTNDMFSPDGAGLIRPTGGVAGGHCFLARYRVPGSTRYRFRNSWGTSFGLAGDFEMERADVVTLLHGIDSPGEACLAAEVAA